ncbi:MAG: hypothetical protein K8T89_08635 [Planctomycetes bacterium]|nr:hypothetical protein [Planctomycetota bacterium]
MLETAERASQVAAEPPSATGPPREPVRMLVQTVLNAIPAILTFGLLAGVAYWG